MDKLTQSDYDKTYRENMKKLGIKRMTLMVHKDDQNTVREFAEKLRLERVGE